MAKGRGRKSTLPPGAVEEVLRLTHRELPTGGTTQWSTRSLAARLGIGKDAVAQIWADHNLKPRQVSSFKVSNDPRFEEKLVDVVGVYLNPPARAVQRNGTIEVFAAMNIAAEPVFTDLHKGHSGADVLRFFKQIDASVPRGLGVHSILDNLSAHSHRRLRSGWPTRAAGVGTCTSLRPPAPGSTSSNDG